MPARTSAPTKIDCGACKGRGYTRQYEGLPDGGDDGIPCVPCNGTGKVFAPGVEASAPPPSYLTDPPADPVAYLAALLMDRSHQPFSTGIGEHICPWEAKRCAEVAAAAFAAWSTGADLAPIQALLKDLSVRIRWSRDTLDGRAYPQLFLESLDDRPLEHGSVMILLPPGGRPGAATHAALVEDVREYQRRTIHWHSECGRMCKENQRLLQIIADIRGKADEAAR